MPFSGENLFGRPRNPREVLPVGKEAVDEIVRPIGLPVVKGDPIGVEGRCIVSTGSRKMSLSLAYISIAVTICFWLLRSAAAFA